MGAVVGRSRGRVANYDNLHNSGVASDVSWHPAGDDGKARWGGQGRVRARLTTELSSEPTPQETYGGFDDLA